jgi:hypothetical protein
MRAFPMRMEVVMNKKKFIGLSLVCCLVVPNFVLLHSTAWGGCTVQQRIELGKQGYDKEEVEKACTDDGEDFWETLSKGVVTDLANGLTNSLTKGLNHALVGRESNSTATASTPADALHVSLMLERVRYPARRLGIHVIAKHGMGPHLQVSPNNLPNRARGLCPEGRGYEQGVNLGYIHCQHRGMFERM